MRGRSRAGRSHLALLLVTLFLAAAPGCALRGGALAQLDELAADEALPPFWKVESGAGASLALLGAIHLGPPDGWVFPPAVEQAFDASSALVVEVDPDELEGPQLEALIGRYGMLPPGASLRDRVSPETWALVEATATRAGLPVASLERMQPWFVGTLLVTDATRRLGYSARGGVDVDFISRAGERSVVPLESAEYQLALLSGLPKELQELVLLDAVGPERDIDAHVREIVARWRVGDVIGLEAVLLAGSPDDIVHRAFDEIVFVRRNREMAERLRVLLEAEQHRGEVVFVVVGAGHLIGEQGIPAILERRGYRVTRLDRDALGRREPTRAATREGAALAQRP